MDKQFFKPKDKECIRCGKTLSVKRFSLHSRSKDGRQSMCKACHKEYAREWYLKNREKVLERTHKYKRTEKGRLVAIKSVRKYQSSERGQAYVKAYKKTTEARRKNAQQQQEKFPEKYECRKALTNSIVRGEIKKRNICEICYAQPTHCHHDDYTKPFDFVELCSKCHGFIHRKYQLT